MYASINMTAYTCR